MWTWIVSIRASAHRIQEIELWHVTRAMIIGERFMGYLAQLVSAIAFRENSAMDVQFYFYPLQCRWKSFQLRKCGIDQCSMNLPAKMYSNTNIPPNNWWGIHKELRELGLSRNSLLVVVVVVVAVAAVAAAVVVVCSLNIKWKSTTVLYESTRSRTIWLVSCFRLLNMDIGHGAQLAH